MKQHQPEGKGPGRVVPVQRRLALAVPVPQGLGLCSSNNHLGHDGNGIEIKVATDTGICQLNGIDDTVQEEREAVERQARGKELRALPGIVCSTQAWTHHVSSPVSAP
eukprot:CAMPEP_0172536454 /NCGR_PEP_ID=MMETSP1067-20121228/8221_1 /TAXON_ID=265564 ORGANISM="Thalassiosira punctigera, Strain Tpunct2005C2" /NCGR_SAMPLE_ID=MMETSP1067 /ASSEMBLY_ACC=CAM_ASM_000444 /LENGTH=107 /DNA_ID=CAMNT_0013321533 /DNA_START=638 /DNA_END=961 /DNA_ORIENTATION=+